MPTYMIICIVQLDMWTEKEFTYDVSYTNQTTATIETETSSDEDDISGPPMIRELKTGLCLHALHMCAYVCMCSVCVVCVCACVCMCIYT